MPQPRRERMHPDIGTRLDSLAGDPFDILMRAEGATADEMLAAAIASLDHYRPPWHASAECRGSGVNFYSTDPPQRAAALELCGRCEVRVECLAWALEVDDRDAVLGGMDPGARKAHARVIARRRKATT